MLTRIKIYFQLLVNQSVSKTSETTNRMIFTVTKVLVHFYKNSRTSWSFSMTLAVFHDFPGLENGLTKFHDFPGTVVTLCLSVGLSVCHNCEPCKNGWINWNAICVVDLGGPNELCITQGARSPMGRSNSRGRKWWPIVNYRKYHPCAVAMRSFVKLLWPNYLNCWNGYLQYSLPLNVTHTGVFNPENYVQYGSMHLCFKNKTDTWNQTGRTSKEDIVGQCWGGYGKFWSILRGCTCPEQMVTENRGQPDDPSSL